MSLLQLAYLIIHLALQMCWRILFPGNCPDTPVNQLLLNLNEVFPKASIAVAPLRGMKEKGVVSAMSHAAPLLAYPAHHSHQF